MAVFINPWSWFLAPLLRINRLGSKKVGKEEMLAAKRNAAQAAIALVPQDCLLGVGTGSTTNEFIALLPGIRDRISTVVSSSQATTGLLRSQGFEVVPLTQSGTLDLYVDGADETDQHRRLIKGGGAALTGEKILVFSSRRFVCIVDQSKQVKLLGKFPLPVEVIPMARSAVARKLIQLGGQPIYREERNYRLRQRAPRRPQPKNPRPRRTRDRNKPNPRRSNRRPLRPTTPR